MTSLQVIMFGWFWTVQSTQSGLRTLTPSWMTPRNWHLPMETAFRWRQTARLCLRCTTLTTHLLLRSLATEWCSSALRLLTGDHCFRCCVFTEITVEISILGTIYLSFRFFCC